MEGILSPSQPAEPHHHYRHSDSPSTGYNTSSNLESSRPGNENHITLEPGIMDEIEATLSLDQHALDYNSQAFADFFEQIMMPTSDHLASNQTLVAPPDVSSFVQDMQFSLEDFDFQLLEPFPMDSYFPSYPTLNSNKTVSSSSPSTLSLRADAFQLSPWFVFPKLTLMHDTNLCREWNPPQHHDSLSRQQDISIDEARVPSDSGVQPSTQKHPFGNLLDVSTRDKIFKVVLNICSPKHSISSFPSQALLHHVVEVFYAQEVESLEARVQPNTSALINTLPELILAFIAAGSVSVNSDSIKKMGMAFQEVVRLAVAELVRHPARGR
jgi:hypothetical protein